MNRRTFVQGAGALMVIASQTPVRGATDMADIQPFKIAIPQVEIDGLKTRLATARWPVEVEPDSWDRGIPGGYLKQLVQAWHDRDWHEVEVELNRHEQVMIAHDGAQVHAFHIRSPHENALPLVLCHGWPSSGIEYLKLFEPLTNPTAFGGSADEAFHLIVPTSPGFGLSPAPTVPGWTTRKTAEAVLKLLDHLGYDRFGLHGTDMGTDTASKLDVMAAGRAVGIHVGTDLDSVVAVASFTGGAHVLGNPTLSDEQRERIKGLLAAAPARSGYIAIQSTRPKTIGYGLNDSPIGQLGWIGEKYAAWTDASKDRIEDAMDLGQFLTTASLYWFNGGGAGSANALYEAFRTMDWAPPSGTPNGVAVFGADPLVRVMFDPEQKIGHWSEFSVGGHFPAMEQPDLLAGDLRKFFGPLRP
jgi:pimeloyl-ACP methyl ester carboxylesterase